MCHNANWQVAVLLMQLCSTFSFSGHIMKKIINNIASPLSAFTRNFNWVFLSPNQILVKAQQVGKNDQKSPNQQVNKYSVPTV